MNRGLVITVTALLSGAAPALLLGQPQAPLIVAYMTSDAELVPVARYDGRTWLNTWPEPIEHDAPLPVRTVAEIPRAWLGQPVPSWWTAWSPTTGKQQRITVTGVDRDGSCVQAITLAASTPDAPSEGLAFNRPTRVDAIIESQHGTPIRDLSRQMAGHFRMAIMKAVPPQPGEEQGALGAKVFALARGDKFAAQDVVVTAVYRDPRLPALFIEAERHFSGIPADTQFDALSYRGWFRSDGGSGALIPISASVAAFSTAEGRLPRYTPEGILRFGGSIWVMSEWGIESQAIVLFDVSSKAVRKLTSADISGC